MRLRMSFASPLNVLGGAFTCSYHIKLNGIYLKRRQKNTLEENVNSVTYKQQRDSVSKFRNHLKDREIKLTSTGVTGRSSSTPWADSINKG